MSRLVGEIASVTGGAQGIGRATFEGCAREGAHAAVAIELLGDARMAAAEIEGFGPHVEVTDPASIVDGVHAAEEKLSGIDILVNNAGIFNMAPVEEIATQDDRRQCGVNFGGTMFVPQSERRWEPNIAI